MGNDPSPVRRHRLFISLDTVHSIRYDQNDYKRADVGENTEIQQQTLNSQKIVIVDGPGGKLAHDIAGLNFPAGLYMHAPGDLEELQVHILSIIERLHQVVSPTEKIEEMLALTLVTDKVEYSSGEEVVATIKLTNMGNATAELELPLIYPDLLVLSNGDVVYQRSKHFIPPPTTRKMTLEMGGEETSDFTWRGIDDQENRVPSGKYTIMHACNLALYRL